MSCAAMSGEMMPVLEPWRSILRSSRRRFCRPRAHGIIGPVSEANSSLSGSGAYRPRGTDTLTWGDTVYWVRDKIVLAPLMGMLPFDILSGTSDAAPVGSDEPAAEVQPLAQQREVARMLTARREEGSMPIMSSEDVQRQIARYEQSFGMSSAEFLQRVLEGTAPDSFEAMDWMILLRYR